MTKVGLLQQLHSVAPQTARAASGPASAEPAEADACLGLYRQELSYLIGSLRRLGIASSDIDDVLHEVFIVMLRRWEDYDIARPPRPWLFGIAFRVASGHRRRNGRELLRDGADAEDWRARPDEMLAATQQRRLLLQALAAVPLERRAVLILHDVDEVAMREIAEQLSVPLFTAYSRLRKARRELDSALKVLLRGGRDAR